jgi:hypothetical protein
MTVSLTSMAYRGVNTGLEFRFRDWGGKAPIAGLSARQDPRP